MARIPGEGGFLFGPGGGRFAGNFFVWRAVGFVLLADDDDAYGGDEDEKAGDFKRRDEMGEEAVADALGVVEEISGGCGCAGFEAPRFPGEGVLWDETARGGVEGEADEVDEDEGKGEGEPHPDFCRGTLSVASTLSSMMMKRKRTMTPPAVTRIWTAARK